MKTKPITFDTHSIQAILNGQKTQFRRVVKPSPEPVAGGFMLPIPPHCPYGYITDTLWARETFAVNTDDCGYIYKADDLDWESFTSIKWKSPVIMPRYASRITLEIAGVKVERLNDVTPLDCYNEGIRLYVGDDICPPNTTKLDDSIYLDVYIREWGNTQTTSWGSNPWVWVVNFKRID